jgi:3-deoxy-D-manno-octulosonic-acid transferase
LWLSGRKKFPSFKTAGKTVWMHCASLGEFEQGRPLIEKIKQDYPSAKIVVTFFSPSGYEIRKNYIGADAIFYLPMDGAANAEKFIDIIQPDLVLWIKYEYWYYYLSLLKKRNIPVLLISGIFRESQPFFKWYGKIWKEMLHSFKHLFLQNERSMKLVQPELKEKVSLNGDTRFDRVIDIAEKFEELPEIKLFCGNSKVVVAGSTWEEDETELIHYVRTHPEIKFIIAPHEVDKENLAEVKKEFKKSIFYSQLQSIKEVSANTNVLIIDNIGMLSRLYKYATVTYVGGGFNTSGIHNVLEAAVYGRPVIFGPVYEKFIEAKGLVEKGGAFSINNAPALENLLDELLNDIEKLSHSNNAAKEYVYQNRGATGKIMNYIAANRLLIN